MLTWLPPPPEPKGEGEGEVVPLSFCSPSPLPTIPKGQALFCSPGQDYREHMGWGPYGELGDAGSPHSPSSALQWEWGWGRARKDPCSPGTSCPPTHLHGVSPDHSSKRPHTTLSTAEFPSLQIHAVRINQNENGKERAYGRTLNS